MAIYGTDLPCPAGETAKRSDTNVSQRSLKYRVAGSARGEPPFVAFPPSHPWCVAVS
jgi:hypothetical protein